MRTILASVLILLATTPAAVANRWSDASVKKAIETADSRWPDSPCYGNHQIKWIADGYIDPEFGAMTAEGYGDLGGCRVWIHWDHFYMTTRPPELRMLCTVLMHEFGHNAGYNHSDNPRDVMYPYTDHPQPECIAAFPFRRPLRLDFRSWGR